MSIVIKKKQKFVKKKIIQRIIALICIYFISFFSLYAIFGEKNQNDEVEDKKEIVYANDGERYMAEGNYTQAIEYYLKSVDLNSEDFVSLTKLGSAYKNIKEYKKAKYYLYKSKELAPNYSKNYIEAADIYIEENNYNVAENAIDEIPTNNKTDFLSKAKLLIKLADAEPDLDEKIIHYERALNYLKKYDSADYSVKCVKLTNLFLELADLNLQKKDVEGATLLYKKILKYQDDCKTRNILAKRYLDINDEISALKNMTVAVQKAKTQEEKRLTREHLITLKYYFEQKQNNDKIKLMNDLLALIDESKILVDEKHMPITITDDKLSILQENDDTYSVGVTFSITNKTEKKINSLYAKADIYINENKILDNKTSKIVKSATFIPSKGKSDTYSLKFKTTFTKEKLKKCTIALSLSSNGNSWQLYRLYTPE